MRNDWVNLPTPMRQSGKPSFPTQITITNTLSDIQLPSPNPPVYANQHFPLRVLTGKPYAKTLSERHNPLSVEQVL